jgi:hypothetical protein
MLIPIFLGYVVGATAVYAFLYKSAPLIPSSEFEEKGFDTGVGTFDTTVIELFPEQEVRRAA